MTEGAEAGIGARIMARRKALGMKRPELAERLGVKPNTLKRNQFNFYTQQIEFVRYNI